MKVGLDQNTIFNVNFNSKIKLIKNLDKQKQKKIYLCRNTRILAQVKSCFRRLNKFQSFYTLCISKLSTEIFLNNFIKNPKYKIIIARFSNFYGCGQPMYRLIPKLIYCINKKIKFPLEGTGNTKRDFIFEDDFNNGLLKIKVGKIGEKYHFSGNKYYTIRDVIKKVIKTKEVFMVKIDFKETRKRR